MQIKITVKYYLIPVRMAIIKKSTYNKCWRTCGEKGTLPRCWGEFKLIQLLWRMVWRFLKNLKTELTHDPTIPLLASASMLNSFSLTVCNPMDCSPPGVSVHGILQAKIVEWVAISFSRGSSLPRNQTNISYVSCIDEQVLYHQPHLENLSWAHIHRKPSSKKIHATQCSLQRYLK